jgi:Fe-S-cluster containining protein
MADFTDTDPQTFLDQYCTFSGRRPILKQRLDGYCIFWNKVCTIHPVKPKMCRAWPYIHSVLIDMQNWYIMAKSCPGMRTDIRQDLVRQQVKRKIERSTDDESRYR